MPEDLKSGVYANVFFQQKPHPTVCYRSGLTVYEEVFVGGRLVSGGWNGAGFPLDVTTLPQSLRLNPGKFALPQTFRLEIDGQSLGSHWEWESFGQRETENGGVHARITLRHRIRPVTVVVNTLLDGTPVLTRWLEVTNRGGEVAALSALAPLSGGLQATKRWKSHVGAAEPLYRVGYMESASWGMEGSFRWHALPNAEYRVGGRFRRDKHRHPMFVLRNEATGEWFVCQFGWSGGYAFEFDLETNWGFPEQDAFLAYAVEMDGAAPLRTLAAGETAASPQVHMGMLFGDFDAAIQAMHAHLRRSVMKPQARGRGCWVESGLGPESEMTEAMTLRVVEDAAALGAELFFIDAGWYTPPKGEADWWTEAGDWQVNAERYPNGLATIRDAVKSRGMLFGLWMDAERLGKNSKAAEAHADWIATDDGGNPNAAGMLDLTNPEAAAWMENEIARLIEEQQLDFFRLDFNVGGWSAWSRTIRDGYAEDGFWRYYEALYAAYDRLRERFPQVVFENCAGGGGRSDVGMVSRFAHTWVTDWQIAPRAFAITNGMTMALPPEYVDRLIGGQNGHSAGSIAFQARLLLFCRPTLSVFYPFGAQRNEPQMAFVKHTMDIYKSFVREFMPEGRIYHHTPEFADAEPQGWGVLELASADRSKGIVGAFQLANPREPETVVRLRGADETKRYRVTWDNSRHSAEVEGFLLGQTGLRIRLEGALTSELLLYEEI